jgi:hypothetical protein
MALSQAAAYLEKTIGHGNNATTEQDITNPGRDRAKYADPSGKTMKALCWMGKNTPQLRKCSVKYSAIGLNLISMKSRSRSQEWSKTGM